MSNKRDYNKKLIILLAMLGVGYVLVHDIMGGTLFDYNDWDSYTLQALAWRKGKLSLDEGYSWLELAYYNGEYYVSFPPLPSVIMLPLTFMFDEVPSNFVMACYTLGSIAVTYKIFECRGYSSIRCSIWSVVLVLGSNMMWMSTIGGVWFLAQGLNMLLCLGAVLCVLKDRRYAAYILLALAVGCRPFSALYFILLIFMFLKTDVEQFGWKTALINQLKYCAVPAVTALAYMLYNYARFDSPLEFGHNYLPEFTGKGNEQFSIRYLPGNLYNLFLRGITFEKGILNIPQFNGFMFYIANPFYIIWFGAVIRDALNKELRPEKLILIVLVFLNIIFICMHRTLGGWQFGARYTVDMLPFALMYCMMSEKRKINAWEYAVGAFAVMFNLYGMVSMNLK